MTRKNQPCSMTTIVKFGDVIVVAGTGRRRQGWRKLQRKQITATVWPMVASPSRILKNRRTRVCTSVLPKTPSAPSKHLQYACRLAVSVFWPPVPCAPLLRKVVWLQWSVEFGCQLVFLLFVVGGFLVVFFFCQCCSVAMANGLSSYSHL